MLGLLAAKMSQKCQVGQWDSCPIEKKFEKKKIFQFSIMIRIKQSDLFENQNIGQK